MVWGRAAAWDLAVAATANSADNLIGLTVSLRETPHLWRLSLQARPLNVAPQSSGQPCDIAAIVKKYPVLMKDKGV